MLLKINAKKKTFQIVGVVTNGLKKTIVITELKKLGYTQIK